MHSYPDTDIDGSDGSNISAFLSGFNTCVLFYRIQSVRIRCTVFKKQVPLGFCDW